MDKGLLIKVLGKVHGVKFEDVIYNLRDITYDIRSGLIQNMDIFTESYLKEIIRELQTELLVVKEIKEEVNSPEKLGYTNSRIYLEKYLSSIEVDITYLVKSLLPFNKDEIIRYNNLLCDEVLKY